MESGIKGLTYSEALVFLGISFFMATMIVPSQKEWFSILSVENLDESSYRMNGYMTRQ